MNQLAPVLTCTSATPYQSVINHTRIDVPGIYINITYSTLYKHIPLKAHIPEL